MMNTNNSYIKKTPERVELKPVSIKIDRGKDKKIYENNTYYAKVLSKLFTRIVPKFVFDNFITFPLLTLNLHYFLHPFQRLLLLFAHFRLLCISAVREVFLSFLFQTFYKILQ